MVVRRRIKRSKARVTKKVVKGKKEFNARENALLYDILTHQNYSTIKKLITQKYKDLVVKKLTGKSTGYMGSYKMKLIVYILKTGHALAAREMISFRPLHYDNPVDFTNTLDAKVSEKAWIYLYRLPKSRGSTIINADNFTNLNEQSKHIEFVYLERITKSELGADVDKRELKDAFGL